MALRKPLRTRGRMACRGGGQSRSTFALPNGEGLRRRDKNCQFRKHLKIFGIVRIDSLNAIGLHGRDNLQIEYVPTRYGTATKQSNPPFYGVDWDGQHLKKR